MPQSSDEFLLPLTRTEASRLRERLHRALYTMTASYTFEQEPEGWFAELAWLENLAMRQATNRDVPKR
jgi:hypothetical protein